jgi:hypothetical protein
VVDSRKILMAAISIFVGNERLFVKTILIVLVCFLSFAIQVDRPHSLPWRCVTSRCCTAVFFSLVSCGPEAHV